MEAYGTRIVCGAQPERASRHESDHSGNAVRARQFFKRQKHRLLRIEYKIDFGPEYRIYIGNYLEQT